MKSPKDIFYLDLDNKGKWKVTNERDTLIRDGKDELGMRC